MLVVAQMVIAAVTAFGQGNAALPAQPQGAAQQPAAAAGKLVEGRLEFEVASVRQNKSNDDGSMNVDPTLTDGPVSTGGLYLARNIKLIQFIAFAYRLTQIQLASVVSQAPWVADDRFDIEARAAGDPGKAQYRLMMQSLLADRFKLAVHYETRQVPLYALVLARPGKLGPQLRLHRADDPVCTAQATQAPGSGLDPEGVDTEGFPTACGSPLRLKASVPGRMKVGGRDVSMARFAAIETGVGQVDRPMIDQTGLQGNVDYSLEWRQVQANAGFGAKFEADDSALNFEEALKDQLGIKMVSRKGPAELFFVDHIEHPSPN